MGSLCRGKKPHVLKISFQNCYCSFFVLFWFFVVVVLNWATNSPFLEQTNKTKPCTTHMWLFFHIKYLILVQQLLRFNLEAENPQDGWGSTVKNRLANDIIASLLLNWIGITQLATQWLLPASPGASKAALDRPYQEESVWKSTFWNRTNINQACGSWVLVNFRNVGGVNLLCSWVSSDSVCWRHDVHLLPSSLFTDNQRETAENETSCLFCFVFKTRRIKGDEEVMECCSKQNHECWSFYCRVETAWEWPPLSHSPATTSPISPPNRMKSELRGTLFFLQCITRKHNFHKSILSIFRASRRVDQHTFHPLLSRGENLELGKLSD